MGEMKPTPGPLVPQDREKITSIPLKAIDCERLGMSVCFVNGHREAEAKANAILISEAFQVHHETSLTPRQLVERVKELEEALRNFTEGCSLSVDAGAVARAALSKDLHNAAAKEAGK